MPGFKVIHTPVQQSAATNRLQVVPLSCGTDHQEAWLAVPQASSLVLEPNEMSSDLAMAEVISMLSVCSLIKWFKDSKISERNCLTDWATVMALELP